MDETKARPPKRMTRIEALELAISRLEGDAGASGDQEYANDCLEAINIFEAMRTTLIKERWRKKGGTTNG